MTRFLKRLLCAFLGHRGWCNRCRRRRARELGRYALGASGMYYRQTDHLGFRKDFNSTEIEDDDGPKAA